MCRKLLPVCIALFLATEYHQGHSVLGVVIYTVSGALEGRTVKSSEGILVDEFLGIPYALPPVGRERFSPPKALLKWSGILKAKDNRIFCAQLENVSLTSEDCLTLNIWVPWNAPNYAAVMIWIHGDSYLSGSANELAYNGKNLAAQGRVIVVSINYRLTMFGFLYLDIPEAPGNVGLMDQKMAMAWIQRNIFRFGGDPNRVTIFGASAGASSVGLHLLIPSSRSLFQRVIMQSGSPGAPFAYMEKEQALNVSLDFAHRMNCYNGSQNRYSVWQCLVEKDGREMVIEADKMDYFDVLFTPVPDGTYIPEDPVSLLQRGDDVYFKDVLIGTIDNDAAYDISSMFPERPLLCNSTYSYDDLEVAVSVVLKSLSRRTGLNTRNDFLKEVVAFKYYNYQVPENSGHLRQEIINLMTDFNFLCPAEFLADSLSTIGMPVYRYVFDHVPSYKSRPWWLKSVHYDDIQFIFGNRPLNKVNANMSVDLNNDKKLSKRIIKYWTNFAKYGNPNGKNRSIESWPAYHRNGQLLTLHFKPRVVSGYRRNMCLFWNSLIPDLIKSDIHVTSHD